jgi:hypothetical protein
MCVCVGWRRMESEERLGTDDTALDQAYFHMEKIKVLATY